MADRIDHQHVVTQLLESKAIDFEAIGNTVAKLGPSLALQEEPWDSFCLTMKMMVWVYRFPGPFGGPIGDLAALREQSSEIRG
jgi:hypothetical protein